MFSDPKPPQRDAFDPDNPWPRLVDENGHFIGWMTEREQAAMDEAARDDDPPPGNPFDEDRDDDRIEENLPDS